MKRLRTMGQILPGLWIGRMGAIRSIFELQTSDDNHHDSQEEWTVVSILSSESIISAVEDTLKQEQLQFQCEHRRTSSLVKRHEVWDLPDKSSADFVSDHLEEICQIISDSFDFNDTTSNSSTGRPRRNCLVHCAKGVSRSAAVCSAWLMSRQGYSLPQSLDLIVEARNNASPNLGFLAGLKAIEKCQGDIGRAQARLQSRQSKKGNNNNLLAKSNTAIQAAQTELLVKAKEASKSPPRPTQQQQQPMEEKRKQIPMERRSDNMQQHHKKESKKSGSMVQKPPVIIDEEILQVKETEQYSDEISV